MKAGDAKPRTLTKFLAGGRVAGSSLLLCACLPSDRLLFYLWGCIMLGSEFSSIGWQAFESGLQMLAYRQQLLSNNIANANTPSYKRVDLPFKQILAAALGGETTYAGKSIASLVKQDNRTSMKPDGNNVDIEMEMVHLAENNLTYQAAVVGLNYKINQLRLAITEGRKG